VGHHGSPCSGVASAVFHGPLMRRTRRKCWEIGGGGRRCQAADVQPHGDHASWRAVRAAGTAACGLAADVVGCRLWVRQEKSASRNAAGVLLAVSSP
jgi:hypothetical protein